MPIQTRRGVRLTYLKEPAASRELSVLEAKGSLYLPLAYAEQGGPPAASLKTVIRKNQPLVIPDDPASIPVYASVTGTLEGVCTLSHPLYGQLDCAVIAAAPEGDPPPEGKPADLERLSPNDVIEAARQAGIIDELDGVPLHLKLTQWKKEGCGCLVADGVEPEPYASSAWTVLSRSAEQVGQGLALAARCVGAAAYHVAVCLPGDRRRSLQQRLGEDRLFQVRRRYPVDRYAPSSLLRPGPVLRRIGVQALLALYRATAFGEPQTDCVITVAGDAVATPQNLAVPFGVPIREVLAYCGLREDPHYLILGDLMTGRTAPSDELPVLPGMTCLLALENSSLEETVTVGKNAAGVTGLCLLLLVCVRPLLAILAPLLASRLAAAMIEPVEDGPVARLIDRFGDVLSMLLVVVVASCVMAMVLIGATLASGGAVR